MRGVHQSVTDLVSSRVGRTLKDKWRIDALIGTGGMAAVYSATHRNGHRVALKILHAGLSVDAAIHERFLREGYVANTVQHPGVVRILDDDQTEDGAAFLVMELLEGESMAARAERLGGHLPVHEVASMADQLLDTLAAAHDRGVVHRDIKPENVFLTHEGRIKVLDFGIARVREATSTSATSTRTGTLMGTPSFMPPEQALGRTSQVDALSDLWATGACMFVLTAGQLVHFGETANEQLIAAATVPARSLTLAAPWAPVPFVQVVDRALAYDKAHRWPDARAMLAALRQGMAAIQEAPSGPHVPPAMASGLRTAGQNLRPISQSYSGPVPRPSGSDLTPVLGAAGVSPQPTPKPQDGPAPPLVAFHETNTEGSGAFARPSGAAAMYRPSSAPRSSLPSVSPSPSSSLTPAATSAPGGASVGAGSAAMAAPQGRRPVPATTVAALAGAVMFLVAGIGTLGIVLTRGRAATPPAAAATARAPAPAVSHASVLPNPSAEAPTPATPDPVPTTDVAETPAPAPSASAVHGASPHGHPTTPPRVDPGKAPAAPATLPPNPYASQAKGKRHK